MLALVHAELGPLFPVSGGTSRFPHYAFGSFAGATFGWMSYLQAATVAPIEVLAAIQYLSLASFAHGWYDAGKGTLSGAGIVAAVILMLIFVVINMIGIRWLARVNNAATWWKVIIPILAIVVLMINGTYHSQNFGHAAGGFFPNSNNPVKPILLTLPAGIVFSLLGFEQAVQLGGEAANPKRDLARAVILSMIIGAVIYCLLQVAFIGALKPSLLVSQQVGQHGCRQHQPLGREAESGAVLGGRQPGRNRLAGHGASNRCRDLTQWHRAHLPDLVLAAQLRAEQERLRARGVRKD